MTLNSSGPISFGGSTSGQSINLEIGASANATISLNNTSVRTLANVTANNSAITIPTNFYGKTASNAIANNIMRYIVVAGGGSGGSYVGSGGGGAGGLLTGCLTFNSGNTFRITANVGNGGGAGVGCSAGFSGNASLFTFSSAGNVTSLSAVGGGGGAGGGVGGAAGGSGGGGGRSLDPSGPRTGGSGTTGQGNAGGTTPTGFACNPSSGGGGAGDVGLAPTTNAAGGAGGVGRQITIAGATTFYAGGGGGKTCVAAGSGGVGGAGGQGGGGAGTNFCGFQGGNANVNTGGGGGAVSFKASQGGKPGSGGSGIVIIDYASPTALFTVTGGGANSRGNYVCSGTTATRQWIKFTAGNSIATK